MTTLEKRFALAKRRAWNALLDLRYGAILRGTVESPYADRSAQSTESTPYDVLAAIFAPGSIGSGDVLVDVGCGKGRVINWWLSCGCRNKIVGIEMDPQVADRTRHRLRRYRNVSIVSGDVVEHLPSDGTLYYLYNPFGATTMRAFRDRLAELRSSKEVRIYYYHPVHIAVFEDDPMWEVVERRPPRRLWPEMQVAEIRPCQARSQPWTGATQADHLQVTREGGFPLRP